MLTAVPGSWDGGVTLSYQWTANGPTCPAPSARRTHPPRATRARSITVKVTGTSTGYTTVTKESAPTAAVANGHPGLHARRRRITGTPKVAVPR